MTRFIVVACVLSWLGTSVLWAQNCVLEGRIIDNENRQAIELANVYCLQTKQGTYSDVKGEYQLQNLPGGKCTIQVSCVGYQPIQKEVDLTEDSKVLDLKLESISQELEQFVVTATGTQHKLENVPVQTEIISSRDIRENSSRSVEEMIAGLCASFDYSSSSMGSNIKLNGFGKDYILVLVDGKRLTGEIGGYVDLSRIHTDDIKQVEIVRGASSTLYGSDAIAGVINIITKKDKAKISVTNDSRVGIHHEWKQLNTFSFNTGKGWSGKTTFNRKQTDGWQLNDTKYNTKWKRNQDLPFLVKTYDMPVNKKRSYTLAQDLNWEKSERLVLNSNLKWYEKTLYFPFKGKMHNYYYNDIGASLGGVYQLSSNNTLNFSSAYSIYKYYTEYPYKYNETYITLDGAVSETYYPGDRFKNSETHNWNTQLKGVFKLSNGHVLSVGAEVLIEKLESKYRLVKDEVDAFTTSMYVQDEFKLWDRLELVPGIRFIYHNQFGFIATPKVSAMLKYNKWTTYRASYAKGFKAPTLKELYYYYDSERMGIHTLYLGNEDLKPQKSDYFSISSEVKTKRFTTSLQLYLNKVNDMIDYKIIPTTRYNDGYLGIEETKQRYNINQARSYGADFMWQLKLNRGFSIGGGYSYVDARNETLDVRLNGVAEHSANLRAGWRHSWKDYSIKANVSGNYKSDKFYLEEEEWRQMADGYQLWKLTTLHTIRKYKKATINLTLGVDNIFDYVDDRPYGGHYGTLNPGRSLFVGMNIKFTN